MYPCKAVFTSSESTSEKPADCLNSDSLIDSSDGSRLEKDSLMLSISCLQGNHQEEKNCL